MNWVVGLASSSISYDKEIDEDLKSSGMSPSDYFVSNTRRQRFRKKSILQKIKDNEEENEMLRKRLERIDSEEANAINDLTTPMQQRLFKDYEELKSNPLINKIKCKIFNHNFGQNLSVEEYLGAIEKVTGHAIRIG